MKPRLLTLAALAACVGACSETRAPTPPLTLPTLTRAQLTLDAGTAGNIVIPRDALTLRGGIPGVFVRQGNLARFRMVRTGAVTAKHIEIVSGLRGDETLVRGDLGAVHDGSPLTATHN